MTIQPPRTGMFPQEGERRRSGPISMGIPIVITWTASGGVLISEPAETEVISAYEALVRMKTRLPPLGKVTLPCARASEKAQARVVGVSKDEAAGSALITVELEVPDETS